MAGLTSRGCAGASHRGGAQYSQPLAVRLLNSLVSHDLDYDFTVARAIVEIHEDHLLPRPQRHAPPNKWNAE